MVAQGRHRACPYTRAYRAAFFEESVREMFQPVGSKTDFPAMEERILALWKSGKVFEKSVSQREGSPPFILYEGPPTANGNPGIHHVLARVFKDIMPRYKAMKGFYAPRRAGWDTHGLPVELEVEKELGFSSKTQIEAYGVDKFNARCRQSVFKYLKEWENLTDRIGFWVDMEHPYVTLRNEYIETGWWVIKTLWDKKLLYQGFRVTPHCPRCGTSLSSHEVALGYRDDADDPSVYIKFRLSKDVQAAPIRSGPGGAKGPVAAGEDDFLRDLGWPWNGNAPSLLVWTTTPWTLTANVALAVAPNETYALVELQSEDGEQERLVLAKALLPKALSSANYRVLAEFPGGKLVRKRYERLYDPQPQSVIEGSLLPAVNRVVAASFVSMEDGTGIVHIAPAFGADDFDLARQERLATIQTVDLEGKMLPLKEPHPWDGKFVKQADKDITADLKRRGLLYRSERIVHTYPFCWRCSSPLLYYAKPSWYIKTTAVKEAMQKGNEQINWYPEHIKEGRFGDWLRNNVDWALSRERYWGTPLPIWRCQSCREFDCVGSREELKTKPGLQGWNEDIDLHRPYIDQVTYSCSKCGGAMRRAPEVLDCWFDSGAMPFAQWHHPLYKSEVNEAYGVRDEIGFTRWFPADYICEAVDQTRGWFYTLHALSTLVKGEPCFRNVICLGLILDARGEKMSKAKGNVVDPWKVLKERGADALRWYMLTASPPGNVRRFDTNQVVEVWRQFLLTLWNTYSFFVTYALIDKYNPTTASVPEPKERPELDRWILSELNTLIQQVTERLDNYDPTTSGRAIADFVDNLSNWYVRRSRRRFWKSENDADKLAAYATLYNCLVTLCKLLAPFTPFMAEEMYRNLVRSVDANAPESVHLEDYPVVNPSLIDEELSQATRLAVLVSSMGRSARAKASIKVRQPLQSIKVMVRNPLEKQMLGRSSGQISEELNVKQVWVISQGDFDEVNFWDWQVSVDKSKAGPKYRGFLSDIEKALASIQPSSVAARVRSGDVIPLPRYDMTKPPIELLPEEILLNKREPNGFVVVEESGYVVAVNTAITAELKAEGLSREIVHRIQTMRRTAGFDIADYIVTYYDGQESIEQIMQNTELASYIRQETLSRELKRGIPPDAYTEQHKLDGQEITLGVKK